jgi:hypothetical protein
VKEGDMYHTRGQNDIFWLGFLVGILSGAIIELLGLLLYVWLTV